MNRLLTVAFGTVVSLAAFSSCSNDPTVNNGGSGTVVTFHQVDRVGRPGLKEVYLAYAKHDAFNRAVPTTDVSVTGPQVDAFVTGTAGRSAAISQVVQAALVPDALIAKLTDTNATASYLGWETAGQINDDCTTIAATGPTKSTPAQMASKTFGGRGINDDVVSTMLSLAFGNLATSSTLTPGTPTNLGLSGNAPPDDGQDKNGQNGTPNLTNQQTPCANKGYTPAQFPYLGAPL